MFVSYSIADLRCSIAHGREHVAIITRPSYRTVLSDGQGKYPLQGEYTSIAVFTQGTTSPVGLQEHDGCGRAEASRDLRAWAVPTDCTPGWLRVLGIATEAPSVAGRVPYPGPTSAVVAQKGPFTANRLNRTSVSA